MPEVGVELAQRRIDATVETTDLILVQLLIRRVLLVEQVQLRCLFAPGEHGKEVNEAADGKNVRLGSDHGRTSQLGAAKS